MPYVSFSKERKKSLDKCSKILFVSLQCLAVSGRPTPFWQIKALFDTLRCVTSVTRSFVTVVAVLSLNTTSTRGKTSSGKLKRRKRRKLQNWRRRNTEFVQKVQSCKLNLVKFQAVNYKPWYRRRKKRKIYIYTLAEYVFNIISIVCEFFLKILGVRCFGNFTMKNNVLFKYHDYHHHKHNHHHHQKHHEHQPPPPPSNKHWKNHGKCILSSSRARELYL